MKKLILLFTIYLAGMWVYAQEVNVASVFIAMPDDMLLGVDAGQRAELTSKPDSARAMVAASFGYVERTAPMTEDYIALKTSEAGTLEIMLLPLVNNTSIVGVIKTVCGKVCDSRIDFYTTDWSPLAQPDLFPAIEKSLFLRQDVDKYSEDYLNAVAALDMTPVKLSYSPDKQEITVKYDIEGYLSSDDYKMLEPYLIKEPKVYRWDKFSFK